MHMYKHLNNLNNQLEEDEIILKFIHYFFSTIISKHGVEQFGQKL